MAAQQKQSFLILVMIVLMGIVLGYLYYSTYVVPTIDPVALPPISDDDNLMSFQGLRIDFNILTDTKFQSLQIFGESPVNPGTTGKNDLFAPI